MKKTTEARVSGTLDPLVVRLSNSVTIIHGDCRDVLKTLPDGSINCCVTSPPYFNLRDYGHAGQIGLERTPQAYVEKLVAVFREVRRVLRDDGTLWLNLGDSYARAGGWSNNNGLDGVARGEGNRAMSNMTGEGGASQKLANGLKEKDLIGIPWRVAFALQADGWWLRQDIIWHKPNPMPESVRDRCTKAHEYIFLLSKEPRYYFDADAIKEQQTTRQTAKYYGTYGQHGYNAASGGHRDKSGSYGDGKTRNKRSVWSVSPKPFKGAHFATFPPDLIKPCILAGCPEGGTVLDPFGGSGTTGEVAAGNGRDAILIELNPAYVKLEHDRCGLFAQGGTP